VVVSVDEKSQVQALDRTEPMLPPRPTLAARRTCTDVDLHVVLDNLFGITRRSTFRSVKELKYCQRRLHRCLQRPMPAVLLD
jgi:hypothetical protein